MQSSALAIQPAAQPVSLRDVASVMFRHQRMFAICFFTTLLVTVGLVLFLPSQYESSAKVLVERERADAFLSPERTDAYQPAPAEISEADLSSELELMRTDDILRNVVEQTGLAGHNPSRLQIDKAVAILKARIQIEPVNKSNLIGLTYRSTNPQLSANVLNTLIALYLEKHLDIRRSNHEYEFFDRQANLYKEQLANVEKQLSTSSVVAPELTRDQMVDKQADLKAAAAETQAQIAETEKRIASLKELEKNTPERLVTEKRTSDNPQLLQDMKGTLLQLQLQRDQLLAKYQPSYRPVQDINEKIADTQASIAQEESKPLREETTNQNTAYEWIRTERAKSEAELQGLLGRQSADSSILSSDNQNLHTLNVSAIQQQDLLRQAKTAESNYLLYLQKREEARISEELDARKILNVTVVQSAAVPTIHVHQRTKFALIGLIAALLLSLAVVLVSDFFDPRFRSLHELAATLDVPVLAAIPGRYELSKLNTALQRADFPESNTL
jgi:uncharacterized protein involved in exopolysaccharide biosynthesis